MPTKKDDVPDKRRYLSSAARKEEILDAALIEFADRTYNAVSMERLAECAGLSKAGIYAHFNSKEEIFHALLERTTKQLCDFQGWLPDEDLTLPELVDVYIDRLYTTFDSPATISVYRLLLAESARAPALVQHWREDVARG
ncbi:TetR/AcrR family transcriptional regulator, partial [Colwellia sp. TT2012]